MVLTQSTARNRTILMIDSSDHITGKTGLTLTIDASKAGAAFATITPTVTELGSGFYALALTSSHTNTLGDFALHITGAGADPTDLIDEVVVDVPSTLTAVKTQTDKLTFDVDNALDANVQKINDTELIGDGDTIPWGPA